MIHGAAENRLLQRNKNTKMIVADFAVFATMWNNLYKRDEKGRRQGTKQNVTANQLRERATKSSSLCRFVCCYMDCVMINENHCLANPGKFVCNIHFTRSNTFTNVSGNVRRDLGICVKLDFILEGI